MNDDKKPFSWVAGVEAQMRAELLGGAPMPPLWLDVNALTDEQIESLYRIERLAMRHALETFAAMQAARGAGEHA